MSATSTDGKGFSNISATTSAFPLGGGLYMLSGVATWSSGNIEVKLLALDGSTWLSLPTAMKLTASGTISASLPPGTYRLEVTSATGVYAALTRIPS